MIIKYMKYQRKRRFGRRVWRKKGNRQARANRTGGLVKSTLNTLVPDRMLLRFSYQDNVNLTASSPSLFAVKTLRLNSIYDPDLDLVNGHQPLGYDQWGVFYNRYRVYKVKVTVMAANNSTGATQVGMVAYNAENAPNLDDSFFEQPHGTSKIMGGVNGMNKCTLSKTYDLARIVGKSHVQYKTGQNTAGASWNSNPLDEIRLQIASRIINDSASPTGQAIVKIVYYVEAFDRQRQALSYPTGKDPEGDFATQN